MAIKVKIEATIFEQKIPKMAIVHQERRKGCLDRSSRQKFISNNNRLHNINFEIIALSITIKEAVRLP